jgi:sigma-E factor negative regulatory protein RseB
VAVLGPALVGSSPANASGAVPGSDPRALTLLRSAERAETAVGYQGVEELSDLADQSGGADGSGAQLVEVSHLPGRGTVIVQRGSGTDPGRAGFDDEDSRRPDLLVSLLQRTYRLVLGGSGTVVGRSTLVVLAERPDGSVAARFWVDAATGLLLRRDVDDPFGMPARTFAFQRLSLNSVPAPWLPPSLPKVTTPSLDEAQLASWQAKGWPCSRSLGGLSLFDARPVPADGPDVLHLTYSDGLSTVSVFAQPGTLDVDAMGQSTSSATVGGQHVLVRAGQPRQLFWTAGGLVITVVADAPSDVLAAVVADLPHPGPPPTGWSRVERGLARVLSWLNPFD